MATHSMTVPSVDAHGHTARVEITGGDPGGWDVTATLDGRVVASRHCRDWHRAERARAALTTELLTLARRLVEVGALLVMLLGGSTAIARAQDRPAARRPRPTAARRPSSPNRSPRARDRLLHAHARRWQRREERLLSRDVEHADRRRLDYGRARLSALVLRRSDAHRRLGGGFMARLQDGAGTDRNAPAGQESPGDGNTGPLAGPDAGHLLR